MHAIPWASAYPAIAAAFLASLVEVVEAFTILLAVATLRGPKPAIAGTLAALVVLGAIVAILGPLMNLVPLHGLQMFIGVLLLLFGLGWLRKAILRAAGVLALHDESAIYARETAELGGMADDSPQAKSSHEWIAGLAAFKAVLLEGLEVVFIVIAVGAGRGLLVPAAGGAFLAFLAVLAVGVIVHRPLSRVPENTLKFAVGVMLSSFGVFWTGEGLGINWPGGDLALPVFAAIFLAAGIATALALKQPASEAAS